MGMACYSSWSHGQTRKGWRHYRSYFVGSCTGALLISRRLGKNVMKHYDETVHGHDDIRADSWLSREIRTGEFTRWRNQTLLPDDDTHY